MLKWTETFKTNDEVKFLDYFAWSSFSISAYHFWLALIFLSWINFLNPIVFRLMIIVVKNILAFYWLVLLNFCVFVLGIMNFRYKWSFFEWYIESWDLKPLLTLLFLGFLWLLLQNQKDQTLPCHLGFVLYPWDGNDHYKIEMEIIASHSTWF